MDLLEQLKEWVFDGDRSATIRINSFKKEFRIWVYDYKLQTGQFIDGISDINLEKIKEEEDRKQFEELKNKFKGE